MAQLAKRLEIHLWVAEAHPAARDLIKHPRRQRDDVAGFGLHVYELTQRPLLAVLAANTSPIEWMPSILDHDGLPDMGTMTVRLPSEERIGFSSREKAAAGRRRF